MKAMAARVGPVDAGRQRGRRRGRGSRGVGRGAGAARQDGRDASAARMYSQYRCVKAAQCLVLPPGTTAAEGASCFVNPLTALGMVETMRREGHTALVHTAAASNLGQMLNRLCMRRRRRPREHRAQRAAGAADLREQGAKHVCNSSAATFTHDLTEAIVATGATLAFDAIGGGTLAGPDPGLHGDRADALGRRIPALRVDDAQAGVRVRRARHRSDRAEAQLSARPGGSAAGC